MARLDRCWATVSRPCHYHIPVGQQRLILIPLTIQPLDSAASSRNGCKIGTGGDWHAHRAALIIVDIEHMLVRRKHIPLHISAEFILAWPLAPRNQYIQHCLTVAITRGLGDHKQRSRSDSSSTVQMIVVSVTRSN